VTILTKRRRAALNVTFMLSRRQFWVVVSFLFLQRTLAKVKASNTNDGLSEMDRNDGGAVNGPAIYGKVVQGVVDSMERASPTE
jgi:hypothetical protein